jgi:phosphoglycolate phosphatase
VLFITDIDGTLLDSARSISMSAIDTIEKFSGVELSHQYFLPFIGTPIREVLREYIPESNLDEAVTFFRQKLIQCGESNTTVMPFAAHILDVLKSSGFTICAATNKYTILAEQVLKQQGLLTHFSKIYGSDVYAPKPSPEMILAAKSDFPFDKAYMIGDRPEDVMAANSAGVQSIYISNECDYLITNSSARPRYTIVSWLEILEIRTIREAINFK